MAFSEFEDLSGRVLGNRYRIQKEIGRGGFGIVYRAEQGLFSADRRKTLRLRDVALKLFKNQFVHPENAQEVFREAVMLERLASQARARGETPHLVTVYDIGVFETDDDAIPFVAMELAEGGSLSSQIRNLPLPLARAAALLRQVCAGVRLAHDNDIFHRDLKPGNVLFTSGGFSSGGFLMVSDFGVAIDLCDALRSGGCAGDIRYAPPDPSSNRIASGAGDVYSLGVMLVEFLLGENPLEMVLRQAKELKQDRDRRLFDAQQLLSELMDPRPGKNHGRALRENLIELREDGSFENLLKNCLAFEPKYRNASELDRALEDWQNKRPIPPPPAETGRQALAAARCFRERRQYERAQDKLKQAEQKTDASRCELAFEWSRLYEDSGDMAAAIRKQKEGIDLSSKPRGEVERLADLYRRNGQSRAADEVLRDIGG